MKMHHHIGMGILAFVLASCGAKKAVTTSPNATNTIQSTAKNNAQQMEFMNKVYDTQVFQKNIVSKMNFSVQTNGKNISVPGQLRMRKDEVIRVQLQVPIIGSEVGRLEFTKDYVLIVDRIHQEYVKASYDQLDFLKANGITFYSLQALFWNQLFMPGEDRVAYSELDSYDVTFNGGNGLIQMEKGKMSYQWNADKQTGLIQTTSASYAGGAAHGTSSLVWNYDNFKAFASKQFPYRHEMNVTTMATGKKKELKATFELDNISTSADWDVKTTLSNKYKQVSVESVLGKLMSM